MLTIACVFVRGHVDFTPEYVIRLKSMCDRLVPHPHRFVCLTDQPMRLPKDIETIYIPTPKGRFAWWSKLELFNPKHSLNGRILYLDLDVLLVGGMSEIVNYRSDFAMVPDGAPNFKPKDGKQVVKKYNSSVMVWNGSRELDYLYEMWTPEVAQRLWGDQDWLGEQAIADSMPIKWFPRLSECGQNWTTAAKVVLCKKPKNLLAAQQWKWFNEAWQ